MDNAPIVAVKHGRGKTLRIVCPHCRRRHYHSAGAEAGSRYHGHRVAHCVDRHLHGRNPGYHLIDLQGVAMTEQDVRRLFLEMDLSADLLRSNRAHVRPDDLQIEFRQIQKAHAPDLPQEQWLALFDLWFEMYVDGLRAALGRARADVVSAIDRQAARNGPGKPSVCACGKTLLNPDDPAVLAKHAPHVQAAAQGKPMSDDDKDGSNALADLQATLRELAEAVRDRLHALDERLAAPERKVSEEGHRWTPMASS